MRFAPSGSGNFEHSGLFADGLILNVTNQGLGSDIRGDIASHAGIQNIILHDGSIIDSDIAHLRRHVAELLADTEPNSQRDRLEALTQVLH